MIGKTVRLCQILKRLGEGEMGVVLSARAPSPDGSLARAALSWLAASITIWEELP